MSLEKKLQRVYQQGLQEGEQQGYIKGSKDAHEGWIKLYVKFLESVQSV